ncbi:hypothetical protein [Pontibacter saemangeumensis]|uniref:hypothetical protein n=1 Tax=Pontibacter saemangeumensis TaxID=1084525 RepID=UPI0031F1439E
MWLIVEISKVIYRARADKARAFLLFIGYMILYWNISSRKFSTCGFPDRWFATCVAPLNAQVENLTPCPAASYRFAQTCGINEPFNN